MRSLRIAGVLAMVLLAACGDDSGGGQQAGQPGAAPVQPPPAPGSPGSKKALTPQVHVEDRVVEAERTSIRHQFRERDFAPETNRDPFQASSMIVGTNATNDTTKPSQQPVECKSTLIASNYSYADLKLVGIVAQGTQRKVLMMDPGNMGRIIHTGDCVGKEKALVKEIGTNYLTFLVTAEAGGPGKQARTDEHSIPLHANDLDVSVDLSQPTQDGAPEASGPPVVPAGPQSTQPAPMSPAPTGPAVTPTAPAPRKS
jgi:Tfp pilus assembly protein PilP